MNNPGTKMILLIFVAVIITVIIYWNDIFPQNSKIYASIDTFVDSQNTLNTATVDYEFDNRQFPETIVEKSIKNTFAETPLMACNYIPTLTSKQCTVNGTPIVKYKFPVHLMKLTNGKTIALFNDGRLYIKDRLLDKMWQGPLLNSFPDRSVPLRFITLNPAGDRLVGIGYDNRAYIKKSNANAEVALETEWDPYLNLEDIIFLMYEYNESSGGNNIIVINTDGDMLKSAEYDTTNLTKFGALNTPILKLICDPEGYMMAIDSNFNLRAFDKKDWQTSGLSDGFRMNPNKVSDVLYDKDQLMFGLVFISKTGLIEVMKQEDSHLMAPFVPLELNKYIDSNLDKRLTERTIIKSKLGIYPGQGLLEEDTLDDDVNMAYQRQLLTDKKRLRDFCAARSVKTDVNYKDYDVIRTIDENKLKIDRLNKVITDLISFDPEQKAIKESIAGIDYISATPTATTIA